MSALSENPLPVFAGAFRDRSVAPATRSDAAWCTQLLTLAFSNDPAARWMYPDAGQFLHYFPQFVEIFGGMASRLRGRRDNSLRRLAADLSHGPPTAKMN